MRLGRRCEGWPARRSGFQQLFNWTGAVSLGFPLGYHVRLLSHAP